MLMASDACSRPPGEKRPTVAGDDSRWPANSDPRIPLSNLSLLGRRVDAVRRFISDSLDGHAGIGNTELRMVSAEISSAIQQIILNGAALLASAAASSSLTDPVPAKPADLDPIASATPGGSDQAKSVDLIPDPARKPPVLADHDPAVAGEEDDGDCDIVEIDAVELLAEHVHFCDICGKGFKRDANLRMHMRAHGNRFKTLEALSKPEDPSSVLPLVVGRKIRFSCPFAGCNRNRSHRRFRPLKSAVCVKNHFKRSHCPKMYSCTRCNRKSFSVLADLKSHLKHCGECRWRCSCGTSFSRKDKLFGHMALFEGHMPAVTGDEEVMEEKGNGVVVVEKGEEEEEEVERGGADDIGGGGGLDPEFLDDLMMDGFGMVDGTAWMDF